MTQTLPIRVLHVVTNMSYGGLENLLMNYYRNIDRTKIQFDFLTHVDIHQDFEEEIEALGGLLYRLPQLNPFSFTYRKMLDAFFAAHTEYQIVHCHLDCLAGIPLKAAKKSGIPVRIAHSHTSNQTRNLKLPIKLAYKKIIPQNATAFFSCGKVAGDWMFEGRKYEIMNNAIDATTFRFDPEKAKDVRSKLGLENQFVIGHVGQFRTEKNHVFLIEIFKQIVDRHADSALVLVGKGPQMEPAKARAEELGILDKVLFLGARPDIPELMQAMDAFVLPSFYEGFPVTMVEAQAAGLPCIISDRVPIECKFTRDVQQVSLSDPPAAWADVVLPYKDAKKQDNYNAVVAAGFDIKSNAKWLEEFYCNAI